jgi:hypothetical protein
MNGRCSWSRPASGCRGAFETYCRDLAAVGKIRAALQAEPLIKSSRAVAKYITINQYIYIYNII